MDCERMSDCIPHRSALSNLRRRSATAFCCDFTIPESPERIKSSRRRNSSITGESSFLKASLNAGALDCRWFDDCCRELRAQLMVNSTHDLGFIGSEETLDPQHEINDQGRSARQNSFPAGAVFGLRRRSSTLCFYDSQRFELSELSPGSRRSSMNPGSRRSSTSSNVSSASFVGREYSSMMEEWVDDCWNDVEVQIMALAGNDFKHLALTPYNSSTKSLTCSTKEDGALHATRSKRREDARIGSMHMRGSRTFSQYAALAKRNSERSLVTLMASGQWPKFDCAALELMKSSEVLSSGLFNSLAWSRDELAVIALNIFLAMELDTTLRIPLASMKLFILSVRARMIDNNYHNWNHVVDVTQTVFCLARASGLYETLSDKQRLTLYLAALCHDIEHPGVNAGYLLKSKSTLAAWYKRDPGLLERHHSVRAFELVACSKARLLRGLPSADQREVSAAVRDVIMATDMRHHGAYVQAVEARLGRADAPAAGTAGASGALLEMQLLLKCADISNAFKPFGVAREWAVRVTDELFVQGDLERAHGLEATPMCDRSAQSRVALQRGFIDGLVAPFLRGMAELHPGLRPQLEQLEANRRRWDDYTDEALLAEVEELGRERKRLGAPKAAHRQASRSPAAKLRPPPLAADTAEPISPLARRAKGGSISPLARSRPGSPLAKSHGSPIARSAAKSPLRSFMSHLHGSLHPPPDSLNAAGVRLEAAAAPDSDSEEGSTASSEGN